MSCTYTVKVAYVDDSYWDDGSRWTHQKFSFGKRAEAIAFAAEATTNGCKVKGQNKELFVRPEARDVRVERTSTTEVDWEALIRGVAGEDGNG